MELDRRTCERASRARDPRFDGRFFVGVATTGIYCRPVCPAPPPRARHMRYFPTAAAAAEAGFRPCLRCRPETAPGTTPWLGTSRTVGRALSLVDDVARGELALETLADRVGVTSRHLRRLFLEQVGATPVALVQTRRLQLAKTLLDETALPLAEVAFAAGYGSVRRFNAALRATYGRTPSELRRLGARPEPSGGYQFRMRFRRPYQWEPLLAFLRARAVPGVEGADERAYRRTFAADGAAGALEVRLAPSEDALLVRLRVEKPSAIAPALARARRVFDVAADPAAIAHTLGADPHLRRLVAAWPGLRVPGAWDAFELAVRAVLGQQVSVAAARTFAARLAERFGAPVEGLGPGLTRLFPDAAMLAGADLGGLGLTRGRAATLGELAAAVADGRVSLATGADPRETVARLQELPGIGAWTAEYIALRALGDPDAFPAGDLGLRRALGAGSAADLVRASEAWRPWRAYAVVHLWQGERDGDRLHRHEQPDRPVGARRGRERPARRALAGRA